MLHMQELGDMTGDKWTYVYQNVTDSISVWVSEIIFVSNELDNVQLVRNCSNVFCATPHALWSHHSFYKELAMGCLSL